MTTDISQFIAAYPGLIYAIIATLFMLVCTLVGLLIRQTVRSFESAVVKVDQILTKLFEKYEDIEHRLTTQETICNACRLSCPQRKNGVKP